jgi:hypothetical protein
MVEGIDAWFKGEPKQKVVQDAETDAQPSLRAKRSIHLAAQRKDGWARSQRKFAC